MHSLSITVWLTLLASSATPTDPPKVTIVARPPGAAQFDLVTDRKGTLHAVFSMPDAAPAEASADGAKPQQVWQRRAGVYYARRGATASSWSDPVRIGGDGGRGARALCQPRVTLAADGKLHAVWMTAGKPWGMWYTRADADNGEFEPEQNVMRKGARGLEAGPDVAADGKGSVVVIWHQGRFADEATRMMMVARSTDNGKTFDEPGVIDAADEGVCACCTIDAHSQADGTILVAYRSARKNVHRDMLTLRSTNGGKSFRPIRIDPWRIQTCPASNTSLASSDDSAFIAWQTDWQAYYAPLSKPTERVTATAVSEAPMKRMQIAVGKRGSVLMAWVEGVRGGHLHWRVFDPKGKPTDVVGSTADPVEWWQSVRVAAVPGHGFYLVF